MNSRQLHEDLKDEFEYPVDHATVLTQIGGTTVDAPDNNDSETVDEILVSDDDEIYETANDLFDSIYGNLDDNYIGRKYYDDRGANIDNSDYGGSVENQNQSF